jgi:NCS2 family nucleobase:cation symporter-2
MKARADKSVEYGVNDIPPPLQLLVLSFQHVLLMFVSFGLTIVFAGQVNGSTEFTSTLVMLSLVAAGIGSIVQSVGLPFIGSGYLCPSLCGPTYLSLSMTAAWAGGMPLVRGMVFLSGVFEMALAPLVHKLRNIFPPFIVGLVVAMVGISVIRMSVISLFGLEFREDAVRSEDMVIGMTSLLVMVLCNIWGKGSVKIYCLLIGMAVGWGIALALLPEYRLNLHILRNYPVFALPSIGTEFMQVSFRMDMLLPFMVVAVSSSLKSFGNLLAAQKISEPGLAEVNFSPIRKGILADGFSTALAGLLGGMAVDTSSSNVGLAGTTKVVSRWICVCAGLICILVAFCPKITVAMSLMPKPVLGASIIFAGCFMIFTGFEEMFNEQWNPRKTFVAGISLFFGLSTAFLPSLYARTPAIVQTIFTDPLPTTTILAIGLNILINLDQTFIRARKRWKPLPGDED